MRLTKVQDALQKKKIKYEYTEVDNCGSLDFLFRGLKFHVWEYEDKVWGAETNVFEAGRSQDIEGDYEEVISKEILSWPDMLAWNRMYVMRNARENSRVNCCTLSLHMCGFFKEVYNLVIFRKEKKGIRRFGLILICMIMIGCTGCGNSGRKGTDRQKQQGRQSLPVCQRLYRK